MGPEVLGGSAQTAECVRRSTAGGHFGAKAFLSFLVNGQAVS
ncbi:hypothetical protein [Lactonifactor longoviformis]